MVGHSKVISQCISVVRCTKELIHGHCMWKHPSQVEWGEMKNLAIYFVILHVFSACFFYGIHSLYCLGWILNFQSTILIQFMSMPIISSIVISAVCCACIELQNKPTHYCTQWTKVRYKNVGMGMWSKITARQANRPAWQFWQWGYNCLPYKNQ